MSEQLTAAIQAALAAGTLLVQKAGGCVTHLDGEPFMLGGRSVLASNGLLHQEIIAIVGKGSARVKV
jgi:myo-inositol-1(or 4)-monophosphatase